ncbi:hypothetical protein [Nitratireductor sp. OM-1]|uniref:hypothetical protein n=1 Tax=Nitratireductor sp. OM-1 TaxID=1756988 RepID=UPI000DE0433F|nr:hypothetical protein [Nitratireductor sp. OM-1]
MSADHSAAALAMRRERARKKLAKMLSMALPDDFLTMIWAGAAIKDERVDKALARFQIAPPLLIEALKKPSALNLWTLETLVNEYLTTPMRLNSQRVHILNCKDLNVLGELHDRVMDLENADDGIFLSQNPGLSGMSRIAQRQFYWQRDNFNRTALFRATTLFHFPEAEEHFRAKHGMSMADFSRVCLLVYSHLKSYPAIALTADTKPVGLSGETRDAAFAILSETLLSARKEATSMRAPYPHVAYKPSSLRQKPCLISKDGQHMLAPIPELVMERCTRGLYYDLVDGGGRLNHKLGENFETYCITLLRGSLERITVHPETAYRQGQQRTPDIRLMCDDKVRVVIECKAKKAPFLAKFGEMGAALKSAGLDELAHGVKQIWQYFADVRRGDIQDAGATHENALGMVLTLDSWADMSHEIRGEIMKRARALAAEKVPYAIDEDLRPVLIKYVDDLEIVLATCTDDSFLAALDKGTADDLADWHLASLHAKVPGNSSAGKPFPFMAEWPQVMSWWEDWLKDIRPKFGAPGREDTG